MKLIGLILIFLASGALGQILARRMMKRENELFLIIRMLSQIKTMITYNAAPVDEILNMLSKGEMNNLFFISNCKEEFDTGISFQDAWSKSILASSKNTCLSQEELRYLISYCNAFGSTDTEGQIANCDLYISGFQQRKDDVHNKAKNALRLYTMLGLLLGTLAVIILL